MALLEVKNLHVKVDDRDILKGLDLAVNSGEVHAIMGQNGSGKSTLAHVLSGKPGYEVTGGEVMFKGADLLELAACSRTRFMNSGVDNSGSPRVLRWALIAVRRNVMVATPGISSGY